MKKQPLNSSWSRRFITGCGLAGLLFGGQAQALDVIDPSGAIYTGVTNSSQFAAAWGATNLFTQNMGGISVGQTFGGSEYAKSGSGDAWVTFEVDQVYSVGSVFWAQRNGSGTGDNMQRMSIWASDIAPFNITDPGTAPNNVIPLQANSGASVWREYILTNIMSGRYFLMHLEQTTLTGNPGGNEMRLGLNPPPTPPTVVQPPAAKTVYTGGSVYFDVVASGSLPFTYQWYKDGVPLQEGGRVVGATAAKVTVSQLSASDVGNYYVAITNEFGGKLSDPAALSLIAAPASGFPAAVMAESPVAYWQLDEAAGPTAFDRAGGYNGAYGSASTVNVEGPRPPAQPGFAAANSSVQTTAFTVDSAVALPPLNLTTNNRITITAWLKPIDTQNPYSGIVFSRSGGTIAGLCYDETGTKLAYQWAGNRVNFDSGMLIPPGEWSMVAVVVTPTNATLYCGTNQSMRMAVDTLNQPIQTFGGTIMIGLDVSGGESARTFNGVIDEVAIYERALSEAEILDLFKAGVGTVIPLPVEIAALPAEQALFTGERLLLNPAVTGTSPITYQWYQNDNPILGATNRSYLVQNVTGGNAGAYYVTAENQANSATSSVVQVTVAPEILRVLDATGMAYADILASSVFGNNIVSWGPSNLFKTDVSMILPGAVMTTEGGGHEWARAGSGDAWIRFEVGQIHDIAAVYWAQRVGSTTGDNMQIMSIWASETTAFEAADPGILPDNVIPLDPNTGNPVWTRYMLTNQMSGRYFLMHLEQTTVTGNPGGAEMRLGAIGLAEPLTVNKAGSDIVLSWPSFGTLEQADQLAGPWGTATGITNGVPVPATGAQKFFRVRYY